ncbi:MAG: DUF1295 domain-containing protein [Fibrobacteraceae bacterium]|nr:DUF1295 domain-containing protein [Fibrobacteraceae bacterium]
MNFLYRYRGIILGFFALVLLAVPAQHNLIPVSGAFLLLAGILFRVEARRVIGEHSRESEKSAPELVTWGIYSKIRHPLYLSNLCVGLGFVMLHLGWCTLTFMFASALFLFVVLLAFAEDKFLEERFGDAFRDWAAKTPAFFPGSKSEVSLSLQKKFCKRSFFSAFIADRWTWVWLLFYSLLLVLRRRFLSF